MSSQPPRNLMPAQQASPDNIEQPAVKAVIEGGSLTIAYNPYHAEYTSAKAEAASKSLDAHYGSAGFGNKHDFLVNNKRLDRELLIGAADILVKHGFLSDAQKESFVVDTRREQLKGYAGQQLEGFLSESHHVGRTEPAKAFVTLLQTLETTGDMASLDQQQLANMHAIAHGDDRVVKKVGPSDFAQVSLRDICESFAPEIEAAVRQVHRTVEAEPVSVKLPQGSAPSGRGGR